MEPRERRVRVAAGRHRRRSSQRLGRERYLLIIALSHSQKRSVIDEHDHGPHHEARRRPRGRSAHCRPHPCTPPRQPPTGCCFRLERNSDRLDGSPVPCDSTLRHRAPAALSPLLLSRLRASAVARGRLPPRTIHASVADSRADDCFCPTKRKRRGRPARPGRCRRSGPQPGADGNRRRRARA